MIVSNLTTRKGRVAVSQYEIHAIGFTIFQSYSTIIAVRTAYGHVILDHSWGSWGNTTTRYRNKFLGMNTAETRANLESGRFIAADLQRMDLEELIQYVRTTCRLNVER